MYMYVYLFFCHFLCIQVILILNHVAGMFLNWTVVLIDIVTCTFALSAYIMLKCPIFPELFVSSWRLEHLIFPLDGVLHVHCTLYTVVHHP